MLKKFKPGHLLVLFLIILAIPLTVILAQRQQNIVQKAAELTTPHDFESREIQNLTNQLLNNTEKIQKDSLSPQDTKETIIQDTIQIAKKRKDLLLKILETSPRNFIKSATLAHKQKTLTSEVQPYVEHEVDTQGSLVVIHTDNFDEKKSTFEYYLKTDKEYKLHFVKDPPRALTDAKIKVTGIALENNIALYGSSNQEQYSLQIIAQATLPPTLGEQKIAVILANFTNNTSQPVSPTSIRQIMFNNTHSSQSIDSFYKENSFNKIFFTGDVFGWYTISPTDCYISTFETLSLEAARVAGIDTTRYNRFIFVFPNDNGCFPSVAGLGTIGGNPSYADIFTPQPEYAYVYAHELGHNVGQHHANFLYCGNKSIDIYQNCTNYEYGDSSDVLGSARKLNHFNGPHKVGVGWIPQSNVQKITSDGTYTITHIETATTNPQILQIEKPDTDESYYISYRQPVGYDTFIAPTFTRGASLHVWDEDNFTQTKLLTPYPNTNEFTFLDNGVFFNPVDGVEIKQLSHSITTATLAIRLGVGVTPTPPPPPSHDGKIIYRTYDNTSGSNLYTIFPDGTYRKKFPVQNRNSSSHPVFSTDGKQVAIYFYNTTTNSANIVIYDYKGNRINEIITPQGTNINNFLFTPDGKSLIVSSSFSATGITTQGGGGAGGGGNTTYTIYRIDTNGTNKQIIIQPANLYINATSISSDGKKILFIKDYFTMFMANVDGTNQEQLLNQAVYYPTFSPDNKFIIYVVWENNSAGLYTYNLATKIVEKIPLALTGGITGPSFSPDGKKLVFVYNDFLANTYTLYSISLDGSNMQQIASSPAGGFIELSQPAWAPDPDFITPTPTPAPLCNACSADVSRDGRISALDYSVMVTCYDKEPTGICVNADINKTGIIDIEDFVCVVDHFGKACKIDN